MKHRHPDYNADTDLGDRPLTQQRDERLAERLAERREICLQYLIRSVGH